MDAAQFKYCISHLAKGIYDGNLECIESVLDRIPVYHDLRKIGDAAENLVKRFHQLADKYNNLKLSYRSRVREFEKDRVETDRSIERLTGLKERLANEAVYSESLLHKNDILLERINELRKENERLQSHSYEYNRIVEKEIEARKRRESHLLEQVASLEQRLQENQTDDVSRRSSSRSSSSSDSSSSSSSSSKSKSSKDCESKESKGEKKDKDRSGRPYDESNNRDKKYTKYLRDGISQSSKEVNESGESTKKDSEKTRKNSTSTPRRTEKVSDGQDKSNEIVEKTRRIIDVTPRSTTITSEKTPEGSDVTPRRTELISETKDERPKGKERKSRSGGKTSIDTEGTPNINEVRTQEEDIVDPKVRELFGTEGRESVTMERQVHQLKEDNAALSKRLRQSKVEINNLNKKLTQLEQIKAGSQKGIERKPLEHADQMDITDGGSINTKDRFPPSEPAQSNDNFDYPDGKLQQEKLKDDENTQVLIERLKHIENENEELRNRLTQVDPEYVQDKRAMDHTGGTSRTKKERNQHRAEVAERHFERVQQLETEKNQLKKRLVTMGDESSVIQDYDTKVYRLEEEKRALEGRLTEAENQVRTLDHSGTVSQTFESENRSLFDRFRSNRQDNYGRGSWWTDRKIDRLERGQKNAEKKLRDAKDDVKDRERTISKLENEIKSLRANDTELRKRMQQERQQLQKVKEELQQTEEQSKALRRSLSTTDRPIEPDVTGSKLLMNAKNEKRSVPSQDTVETKSNSNQLEEENRQLKERSLQPERKEVNEDLVVQQQYGTTASVNRSEHGSGFDKDSDTDVHRLLKDNEDLRDRLNNALQEAKALEESKVRLERERREAEDKLRESEEKQSEIKQDRNYTSHFDPGNGEFNNGDLHLERQLEKEQAEVQRLRVELGHIQKEKEEMVKSYEGRIHEDHEGSNVKSNLQHAKDQIRDLQTRNAELQNELEQQRNELQRVCSDPIDTKDSFLLERSVEGENAEISEEKVSELHQQQDVSGIPDRLKAFQAEDTTLQADEQRDVESSTGIFHVGKVDTTLGSGQLQTNTEDQNGEVQKYQSELQQLKSENEQFQNRINQLQRNLRDAEQDLRRARSDLKNAEDRSSELQSSYNDLQRQLHQQQSEAERLGTELSQTHLSVMEEQGLEEQEEFVTEDKHEKTGGVKKRKKLKKEKEKSDGTEKSGVKETLEQFDTEPEPVLNAEREYILGAVPKDSAPFDTEGKSEDHIAETLDAKVLRLVKENKELHNSNIELKRQIETQRLTNADNEKIDDVRKYPYSSDIEFKRLQEAQKDTNGAKSVMTQTDNNAIYLPTSVQTDKPSSQDSELVEISLENGPTDIGSGNTEHEKQIGKQQAEITQLISDLQNLKDREKDLLDRCNQLQKRIREEEKRVEDVQSELRKEIEKTSNLQKSNADLQKELEKCRADLERVETELRQAREANESVETYDLNKLDAHTTKEEYEKSVTGFRESFNSSREKDIHSIEEEFVQTEANNLESDRDGDRNTNEKGLNVLIEDSEVIKDLRIQVIYLQNEKKEAEERLRRLQRTNQIQNEPKLFERNDENVFTSKRQQSEMERLNREFKKVHGENDDLRQSYIQLQSDSQTDRYELQRIRVEFKKLQMEKGELELRLNGPMDEESSDERQESLKELKERSSTGTSESEEINELRIQNIYLLDEKREIEERLKRLQTEKKKLQLRDSRTDYNILELEDLKKSNTQLKRLTEQQQREIQKLKRELRQIQS